MVSNLGTVKKTAQERQREFARLDAWLQRLHAEHPLGFGLLSLAVAMTLLTISMGLKFLIEEATR